MVLVAPFKHLLPPMRQLVTTTPGLILAFFAVLWLSAFQYCRQGNYRDPTSYFFDPDQAYQYLYSEDRAQQAASFIAATEHVPRPVNLLSPPTICLGVVTVKRRGEQYVHKTIGSLLEGLEANERHSLYLNLLIAHTDQSQHPIYTEKWIEALPDKILKYDDANLTRIQRWEESGWYRNKTIYDYTYLLNDCYQTGAQYIAMVEDDTLAVRGWYSQALKALDEVEVAMNTDHHGSKWLYLRIFYTEDLFGWNSENWGEYFFWSAMIWVLVHTSLVTARRRSRRLQTHLSNTAIVVISCVCLPAFIGLYFMRGRNSIWPLGPGIHEMNKFGCCSQGYIFPREIIPEFLERTDLETDWLVDMMVENIADAESYIRWAVVPSLLQHIGTLSSKGWGFDQTAKNLWNFGFELYERPFPQWSK